MVIWSEPARKNLKQIYDFISQDSEYYAKEVVDKIVNQSEKIAELPKMGREVPEISNENIRELIIYSYRLIYEITSSEINILALVHGRRMFPKNLLEK